MRVIIVEDDQNKAHQIVLYITSLFPNSEIIERQSYQRGLKEILSNDFDLVILDMSIPIFDVIPEERNNSPEAFAGRDILRQMYRHKIESPVVVVSQFETFGDPSNSTSLQVISKDLSNKYTNYLGHVYYNAAIDDWKRNLENLIGKIGER